MIKSLSRAVLCASSVLAAGLSCAFAQEQKPQTGNVIFFHPDGTGLNHWNALRLHSAGPDGETNWDRLPAMAVYKGHMEDSLTATSHGGATTHAYGVKVKADSFGLNGTEEITAASGKTMSILEEAKSAGKAVGIIQTGHIAEPGTAAFLASVSSRRATCEIAKQVIVSGAEVIFAGGEKYLLPMGVEGRHGKGACVENLIEKAKQAGYTIVYTRDELTALEDRNFADAKKLLGVFAHDHTFHDEAEEINQAKNLPHYVPSAPSIADMARASLAFLSRFSSGFILIAEEEGTDNMANENNAPGQLAALVRADQAVGVFHSFVERDGKTLLLMAADSEAGGLAPIGPSILQGGKKLPSWDDNGAPYDGVAGKQSLPFIAPPDANGKQMPFAIAWATRYDTSGAVIVRGAGFNSDRIRGTMDNTEMYRLMYLTLLGLDVKKKAN